VLYSPKNPGAILLVANQQIGDVLLSTALLHDMRLAWPEATIDVLVFKNTAGILAGNPDCNKIIEVSHRPAVAEYWQLIRRIFRRYDLAVTTQGNDRAHQYAFLAAPNRVGLIPDMTRRNAWKRFLCKAWVLLDDAGTHTVAQNAEIARAMGIPQHYELVPPSEPDTSETLDGLLNFDWHQQAYVVVHPFPMWRYKRWTDEGWRALIKHLVANDKRVVITGGNREEERTYCDSLANDYAENVISIAGKTSFSNMATLLSNAAAYVGPDTATTHLAAACGKPTLALFGPTNPVKWAPWPKGCTTVPSPWKMIAPSQHIGNVLLLQGLGDCVPCHQEGCDRHKESESRCMNEMPAGRVIVALETLLERAQ
jgi:heptosyltransferase-3